jgi:hypothetical protein
MHRGGNLVGHPPYPRITQVRYLSTSQKGEAVTISVPRHRKIYCLTRSRGFETEAQPPSLAENQSEESSKSF